MKLNRSTIEWVLEHFRTHRDTDIFPRAFEYDGLVALSSTVADKLSQVDVSTWVSRPHRRALVPKDRYGFRLATQLNPLDSVLQMSLMLEIGPDLEAARIPKGDEIVHSYRFNPDGATNRLYDPA